MPIHSGLTGSDLHENKGVAAATNNTVAVASGGTTVWQKITAASIDNATIRNLNETNVSCTLPDVSTNGSVVFCPVPANCTLDSLSFAAQAATTVADASVSVYNGATLLGTFTVTHGAAGTTGTSNVTGTFTLGQSVKIISSGGSTGACPLNLTLTLSLT